MRPIDADKLIEDAELCYVKVGARSNGKSILTLAKTWLLNEVDCAPTIEAKPIVHAHWEIEYDDDDNIKKCYCSNCGVGCEPMNYCGFCGAQMDEVASDTNVGRKESISQAHKNDNRKAGG
jgi:hypothetical protein